MAFVMFNVLIYRNQKFTVIFFLFTLFQEIKLLLRTKSRKSQILMTM